MRVAIVAPVAIVYGLDAAAAWDIVFGCGDFELAIITEGASGLDEAFAKAALPYEHSSIIILDNPTHNFGGGGTARAEEDGKGDGSIERGIERAVALIPIYDLAFGIYDIYIFGQEEVADIDGFGEQATRIVAQIEDDGLGSFAFQLNDCFFHLASGILCEI